MSFSQKPIAAMLKNTVYFELRRNVMRSVSKSESFALAAPEPIFFTAQVLLRVPREHIKSGKLTGIHARFLN